MRVFASMPVGGAVAIWFGIALVLGILWQTMRGATGTGSGNPGVRALTFAVVVAAVIGGLIALTYALV